MVPHLGGSARFCALGMDDVLIPRVAPWAVEGDAVGVGWAGLFY